MEILRCAFVHVLIFMFVFVMFMFLSFIFLLLLCLISWCACNCGATRGTARYGATASSKISNTASLSLKVPYLGLAQPSFENRRSNINNIILLTHNNNNDTTHTVAYPKLKRGAEAAASITEDQFVRLRFLLFANKPINKYRTYCEWKNKKERKKERKKEVETQDGHNPVSPPPLSFLLLLLLSSLQQPLCMCLTSSLVNAVRRRNG